MRRTKTSDGSHAHQRRPPRESTFDGRFSGSYGTSSNFAYHQCKHKVSTVTLCFQVGYLKLRRTLRPAPRPYPYLRVRRRRRVEDLLRREAVPADEREDRLGVRA